MDHPPRATQVGRTTPVDDAPGLATDDAAGDLLRALARIVPARRKRCADQPARRPIRIYSFDPMLANTLEHLVGANVPGQRRVDELTVGRDGGRAGRVLDPGQTPQIVPLEGLARHIGTRGEAAIVVGGVARAWSGGSPRRRSW